jgi:hypothetical protein
MLNRDKHFDAIERELEAMKRLVNYHNEKVIWHSPYYSPREETEGNRMSYWTFRSELTTERFDLSLFDQKLTTCH